MNDVAKQQLAVLEEFIADELRYMEEEGIEDCLGGIQFERNLRTGEKIR